MKLLFIILTCLSGSLFAQDCFNFAQSVVGTEYKKSLGPIKGNSFFRTTAEVMSEQNGKIDYLVTVIDNNPGELEWKVNYVTSVMMTENGCKLLSIRKSLIQPPKNTQNASVFRAYVDDAFCGRWDPMIIGDVCTVFLTKEDNTKLAIVFNLTTQKEVFTCSSVVVNSKAITPIVNKTVINELRNFDPNYYYMYGTYFNEIFRVVK